MHTVVDHKEYKAHLPALLNGSEPHYVVFTSGNSDDGKPWCRDCRAALPVIRDVVLASGGSLLEVESGARGEWGPTHPLKAAADHPIKYIPTLVHWTAEGWGAQVANALTSDESVESLRVIVAKFVKDTAAGKGYVDRVTKAVIDSNGKSGCGGC